MTNGASSTSKTYDINERAFEFAVRIVKLCQFLEKNDKVSKLIINQLLDAGTSVGSNLEEAKAGQSRKDFIHKNAISLKEARETRYWLQLILATYQFNEKVAAGIIELETEACEIANIVGKIIVNTKG
jgi:four helix bundle protein